MPRFSFDPDKNALNIKNHDGIHLQDAQHVFSDPLKVSDYNSFEGGEHRYYVIGQVVGITLYVVYSLPTDDEEDEIRLISARRATKRERQDYKHGKPD